MPKKYLKTILEHPVLSMQWNYNLNIGLDPSIITVGSSLKVWWQCAMKASHVWPAIICDRKRGRGCPYCNGNKILIEDSIFVMYPELMKEWSAKNTIDPKTVGFGSQKKALWQCKKCNNDFPAQIADRVNGTGCSYCANQKVSIDNCLATKNPKLAAEWHPTKNKNLTSYDVVYGSHKSVWWLCKKGHEFRTTIDSRNLRNKSHRKCPYFVNLLQLMIRFRIVS